MKAEALYTQNKTEDMQVLAIKTHEMDPIDTTIIEAEKNEYGPYIIPNTSLLLFLRLIFSRTFFYLMQYFLFYVMCFLLMKFTFS